MNKREYIENTKNRYKEVLDRLEAIPGGMEEYGYNYSADAGGIPNLRKKIDEHELKSELRQVSSVLGKYKLEQYWITWNNNISISYDFKNVQVWFSVSVSDEQAFIDSLSGGKCKIVETKSKSIQCSV